MTDKLGHDQLAESLAAHLRTDRRMTWCDMQLGSAGSVRPDVYAIFKSYVNPCPTAYEIKVSVADFRSDVTSGKWQTYLKFASAVYFACQDDLIAPKDVPTHCGLIVLKGAWRVRKRAVLSPVTVPQEALLKLVIDGVEREGPRHRAASWSGTMDRLRLQQKFGERVAAIINDSESAQAEVEHARNSAKRIIQHAQQEADGIRESLAPLRAQLCDLLQLPVETRDWELKNAVARLRRDLQENPAHEQLKQLTRSIERTLQHHGYKEKEVLV